MRRRDFVTLLGGAAAWPLAARAEPEQMRRIGALTSLDEKDAQAQTWYAAFRKRLHELGWDVGRNLQIDYRWAGGNMDRIRAYAAELVAMKPDALLASTTPVTAALLQETNTIPIVFSNVSDPVGSGFAKSLAHPGGNATGWTNFPPTMGGKWLELLKEIAPRVGRIGVIFNPITAPYVTGYYMPDLKADAQKFEVKLVTAVVHKTDDLEAIISEIAREPNGGLIVMPDTFTILHRALIIALADKYRVPAIYAYGYMSREGGLLAYGADQGVPFPLMAEYIDRIFRGAKPSDLPVQATTKFELMINLKTAKALGISVPQTLHVAADEVIE
jgi:putative tryptophan/tyrosine transport system substrate-binding protein